jgi:hypothetical protein
VLFIVKTRKTIYWSIRFNLLFLATTILDISLKLLCNNDGSVGIACSSPLNIFIHMILEDGPYGPKHVVSIIRA